MDLAMGHGALEIGAVCWSIRWKTPGVLPIVAASHISLAAPRIVHHVDAPPLAMRDIWLIAV